MSRSGKLLATIMAGGLALVFLLAEGVRSQATYNHFFYLPLVARQHP